jgi:pimeloyl-ACP methyl ester carboxylesterase
MTPFRIALCLLVISACTGSAGRADTEEIVFHSGPFKLVGDLRLPEGAGPFPVVLFVHGDGPNDRTSGVTYPPIMERMLRAGYATLAWDKPGTGESTGRIDRSRLGDQRAQIVLDAMAFVKKRPDIDPVQIGLWGISQAGYVMPRVLSRSDGVAFVVAVSCPPVPGVEQGIYLLASQLVCAGFPADQKKWLIKKIRAATWAETYDEYVRHKKPIVELPAYASLAQFGQRTDVAPEADWHPADPGREYYGYDPMEVIGGATIPILAVFGDKDTQVDPVRGYEMYRALFDRAGHPYSRVLLVPGGDHNILLSETGCIEERNNRSREAWQRYAPGYLDALEQWLRERPR